jgi:Mg-chelatase subunit ChlD
MKHQTRKSPRNSSRRGTIIVLSAFFIVVLLGLCAFAIDLGYIANTNTELQRAVDAGALAGVGVLPDGQAATIPVVRDIIKANITGSRQIRDDEMTIETGHWTGSSFVASNDRPSAIRVVVERLNQPLFFAKIFDQHDFDLRAEAIAQYQPRDIMLALDFSASMNDDSTYAAAGALGTSHVTANLQQIFNELGNPAYGNMTFDGVTLSSTNNTTLKSSLGLSGVSYPFPVGTWNEYFNYVQTNSALNNVGLRKKYGLKTLIHYWLDSRPMHSETPVLNAVSAQPVTALKEATEVFLSYLQSQDTDDRLGLAIYNAADETAVLEHALTENFSAVNGTMQARQAGHYNHYTNIGAGINKARLELQDNAREGAFRMIVLMTDGIANRPTDTTTARAYVIAEAQECASRKIPIATISMGAGADIGLMQQVADITGGRHFNIPGGQTATEYEEDLQEVFGQIAKTRPLKLVQ